MDQSAIDQYGLIGHPVSHSHSPFIHGLFAQQAKQKIAYGLIDSKPEDFETTVRQFAERGGRGLNVTVPHKIAAFELADQHTRRAEVARAANTLVLGDDGQILADNTDGVGLVTDLTENIGFIVKHRRVLVLGAGGAVRGLLGPLADCGPERLVVANRTPEKAKDLVERVSGSCLTSARGLKELSGMTFHLIINGTSAGLFGKRPPISTDLFTRHTLCYDLSYSRGETPFAKWAAENGTTAKTGWGMLVEQAAESFYLWRGFRPATAPVIKALVTRA